MEEQLSANAKHRRGEERPAEDVRSALVDAGAHSCGQLLEAEAGCRGAKGVGRMASLNEVTGWMRQATTMPRMVTH